MVKLRTLGECVIEVGENRIAPDSKVVFALLLFLGLERGRRFTRSALIEMFWPESSPEKASHSLRQTIYQCRKLGADIECTKVDVVLRSGGVFHVLDDVASAEVEFALAPTLEFLPEYEPAISDAYGEWLERHRSMANAVLRRRMLTHLAKLKSRGDWNRIEASARDLLSLDPLNEEGTLALAEAAAMRGSKVEALSILDRYATELGHHQQLLLPANVLRRRITDQFEDRPQQGNPFVGRSGAMEFLSSCVQDARRGLGRTILLSGEPGIGKTRVVDELEKTAKLQGAHIAVVECQPSDTLRPFAAFSEAIPQLLQMRGALGCSPDSVRLLQLLINHERGNAEAESDAPDDEGAQIRNAILDLLDAVLVEKSAVLIFEDVHWIDSASADFIRTIARWSSKRPLLFVMTSRNQGPFATPSDGEAVVRYLLRPLDSLDSQQLFLSLLPPSRSIPDDSRDWFISVAEGNPYFLWELARHYVNTRTAFTIPPSLASLLSNRLRGISSNALRVLQVCALLGRDSTFERFEAVLQIDAFELLRSLEELEVLDLLVVDGIRVCAKHALLSDQAVRLCMPATKQLLHRRIAQVLESDVLRDHSAALTWACALHWRNAGEVDRAVEIIRDCASHLISLGFIDDACHILRQAADLNVDRHQRCLTLLALGKAYRCALEYSLEAEVLTEAFKLRDDLGINGVRHDNEELPLLEARWRAWATSHRDGESDSTISTVIRCASAPDATKNHRLQAIRIGLIIADHMLMIPRISEFFALTSELSDDESLPMVDRLIPVVIYHSVCGSLHEGVQAARKIVDIHREAGRIDSLMSWLRNSAYPLRLAGRFDEALAAIDEALAIAHGRKLTMRISHLLDTQASILLATDRVRDCKETLARAFHVLSPRDHDAQQSAQRLLAEIRLVEGDLDGASQALDGCPVGFDGLTSRPKAEGAALRVLIDSKRDKPIDLRSINFLEEAFRCGKAAGRFDLTTSGLAAGLYALGRKSEAAHVWQGYAANWRRERFPIPTYLRGLLPFPA